MAVHPEIFISAATADLRSAREIVRDALLRLDAHPVVQEHFEPTSTTVREMLAERLRECDAVIHLVGQCAGSEPALPAPNTPRRSYTQIEFDIARELRLPLYIFLCEPTFPFDEHPAEASERAELQRAHRQRITSSDYLYTPVSSPEDLARLVRELPILRGRRVGAKLRFGGCAATLSIAFVLLIGGLAALFNQQRRVAGLPPTHRLTPIPAITPPFNPMATPPRSPEESVVTSPGETRPPGFDPKLLQELFRRIDAAPELDNKTKDRLYGFVDRARSLKRVVTLTFERNSLEPDATSRRALESYLQEPSPRLPTPQPSKESMAMHLVFGFSEPETEEKEALRVSRTRAENVSRLIKKRSPDSMVIEVAGGNSMSTGSAEIWAIVP